MTPAAYCGVTGLRPTYGLVSRYGAMALSWTMDKLGPMCRTAEDCGIVLQTIAGKDDNDPGTAGRSFYFAPQFQTDPKTIRAGFAATDFEDWAEPATRPVFKQALDAFKSMGVTLVETKLPDYPYGMLTGTVIGAEGASIFEELIASERVDELADKKQIAGLKAAAETAALDYLKAMRIRRLIQQDFRQLWTDLDVLIAPASLGRRDENHASVGCAWPYSCIESWGRACCPWSRRGISPVCRRCHCPADSRKDCPLRSSWSAGRSAKI